MFTARSVNFCKGEDCPSSQDLLDYQNGDLDHEPAVDTRIHLRTCEFCTAEIEFYSLYPMLSAEPVAEPDAMPEPLFQLADTLLRRRGEKNALYAFLKELNEPA